MTTDTTFTDNEGRTGIRAAAAAASDERFSEDELIRMRKDFATRMKEAFDGATNAEIARRCKTTSATIKLYADAQRLPHVELLLQMQRATGINLHWLLTGKGPRFVDAKEAFDELEQDQIRELARSQGKTFDEMVRTLALSSLDTVRRIVS